MKASPLGDRILVERIEEEAKTAGGIIIPDSHAEKPSQGKVIAVGDGHFQENGSLRRLAVSKGDVILFGKYAGTEVKLDDKSYLIMREDDVLAILHS